MKKEGGTRQIDKVYLHEDGLPLDFALKNVARVGLWTALAFGEVYPSLYARMGAVVEGLSNNY